VSDNILPDCGLSVHNVHSVPRVHSVPNVARGVVRERLPRVKTYIVIARNESDEWRGNLAH